MLQKIETISYKVKYQATLTGRTASPTNDYMRNRTGLDSTKGL